MSNRKSDQNNCVLAGPHEADRAQPPFVDAGHLPHKVSPAQAKIQEGGPMPKAAWGRVASQGPQHRPQRFGRQILFLEPQTVSMPRKGPHRTGVALERGNAALKELPQHMRRRYTELPQVLEAALDEGKTGARELLMIRA